jgi:hypothetical protein
VEVWKARVSATVCLGHLAQYIPVLGIDAGFVKLRLLGFRSPVKRKNMSLLFAYTLEIEWEGARGMGHGGRRELGVP